MKADGNGEKDRDIFTVAVPVNTTAQICLPHGWCYEVGYGKYQILITDRKKNKRYAIISTIGHYE